MQAFLIACLRVPTDSRLPILSGNALRRSSPWTKQLSSRIRSADGGPEGDVDWVAGEIRVTEKETGEAIRNAVTTTSS